ncbi:small, acid-soluble spore protein, alpha/beta type [Marinicrinis sediminis]|uniref:Small, acid-soluble spore protein, alpha/beta type n=1 Tax=Marinicrinis sediminis TaxID=1652465 RepID=A0ABW5RAK8_9BACL
MANAKVVPDCAQALYDLKYEIAAELGLPVHKPQPKSVSDYSSEFADELGTHSGYSAGSMTPRMQKDHWGHLTARDAGAVGGTITARLIQRAQESLL